MVAFREPLSECGLLQMVQRMVDKSDIIKGFDFSPSIYSLINFVVDSTTVQLFPGLSNLHW